MKMDWKKETNIVKLLAIEGYIWLTLIILYYILMIIYNALKNIISSENKIIFNTALLSSFLVLFTAWLASWYYMSR